MCGISFVLGDSRKRTFSIDNDVRGFVRDAAIVGGVRGRDSTGVFQLHDDKKGKPVIYTIKRAMDGSSFEQIKNTQGYFEDAATAQFTVLHHRAATNGKVTDANAHPFYIRTKEADKSLIGCHNGSLTTWDRTKFEVDSEYAMHELSQSDNALETLRDFVGPYVFTWYDQRDPDMFNIARGKDRPLAFAIVRGANRNYMLGCSEASMLYWLADRNKLSLEDNRIFECKENTLYRVPLYDVRKWTSTPIPSKSYTSSGSASTTTVIGGPVSCPLPSTTSGSVNYTLTTKERIALMFGVKPDEMEDYDQNAVDIGGPQAAVADGNPAGANQLTKADQTTGAFYKFTDRDGWFDLKSYDDKNETAYGTFMFTDQQGPGGSIDTYNAIMFGVSGRLAEAITLADWCEVKCLGARESDETEQEVDVIVERPRTLLANSPSTGAQIERLLKNESAAPEVMAN